MFSVLLREESVRVAIEEDVELFPVEVTVHADGTFVQSSGDQYQVEERSVHLFGSGGTPREFVMTFQLSSQAVVEGYTFANPALKFFIKGSSRTAGFRVSPRPDQISVTVTLFNTKTSDDGTNIDEFSVLINDPVGKTVPHDPTILWEPPLG